MEAEALLDAHIIIWLFEGAKDRFSDAAKTAVNESARLVSPITLLELDLLHECGKISSGSAKIFQYLNERVGLSVPDDSFGKIIQEASHLTWTRNPFDRLLAAHAKLRECALVTKDRLLRKHYSRSVW